MLKQHRNSSTVKNPKGSSVLEKRPINSDWRSSRTYLSLAWVTRTTCPPASIDPEWSDMNITPDVKRTFTAVYDGKPIRLIGRRGRNELSHKIIWWAIFETGEVLGIVCVQAYSPTYARTKDLSRSVFIIPNGYQETPPYGPVLGTVLPGTITSVKDVTPPGAEWARKLLLKSVQQYVRSAYADGHITEGEAWRQAVTLPVGMLQVAERGNLDSTDLRWAMQNAGFYWDLGDGVYRPGLPPGFKKKAE